MYFRGLLNCRMEAAQQVVCLGAARPRHAIGSHGVDCQSVKQMSFYENTRSGTLFSEVSVLFNMVQCARTSSTAYDNIAVFADLVTSACENASKHKGRARLLGGEAGSRLQ